MEQKAMVHVTLDQDLKVAKFDVDLDSIPGNLLDGFEIVPEFRAHQFDNEGTFFTDSNGLKMEKRILNYRSYYNFTEAWADDLHPNHNQNISGNYYPINSAVRLVDNSDNK